MQAAPTPLADPSLAVGPAQARSSVAPLPGQDDPGSASGCQHQTVGGGELADILRLDRLQSLDNRDGDKRVFKVSGGQGFVAGVVACRRPRRLNDLLFETTASGGERPATADNHTPPLNRHENGLGWGRGFALNTCRFARHLGLHGGMGQRKQGGDESRVALDAAPQSENARNRKRGPHKLIVARYPG